jgi:hypothetical protein
MKPQRIARAGMFRNVRRHPTQYSWRRSGSKWLKWRMVRVVTLDTLQANQRSSRRIPIAVDAAMRTVLPIPVDGAVTLGTQFLRLIPGDLPAGIVNECLSVHRMVAIEASRIEAMHQLKPLVLGELATHRTRHRYSAVAFTAVVRERAYRVESERIGLADRRRVRCRCGHRCRVDHGTLITRGNAQQYRGNGQNRGHPGESLAPLYKGRAI